MLRNYITKKRNEKVQKKKFEDERIYYNQLYEGKSVYDLAKVPKNIRFGDNDLPISIDDSGLPYGNDFTVYISKTGECYHNTYGCCGARIITHVFKINRKRECSKCIKNDSGVKQKYPEWYKEYLRIKGIKLKYKIE